MTGSEGRNVRIEHVQRGLLSMILVPSHPFVVSIRHSIMAHGHEIRRNTHHCSSQQCRITGNIPLQTIRPPLSRPLKTIMKTGNHSPHPPYPSHYLSRFHLLPRLINAVWTKESPQQAHPSIPPQPLPGFPRESPQETAQHLHPSPP